MRPSRKKGGFTLVELMAALVAGLVAITAIYAVGSSSARHFQEQQRIAQTQMALRMAMSQLRADIQRAGLFGTANSVVANPPNLRGCPTPSPRIQAVEMVHNPDGGLFPAFADNGIGFDRIRLVGNYATTGSYLITGAVHPNQVQLQPSWQGFRRDFFTGSGQSWSLDPDALEVAFKAGRILHVRTLQDTSVFTPITGVVPGSATQPPRIDVGSPMPITSPCMPGLGDGATVAPLSRIEYAVVNPRDHAELLPLRNSTMTAEEEAALGLAPSVLVRREIAFDDGAVIDGTTRVILEYVADFDIRFVVDTTPPPAAARTFTVVEDAPAQNLANPENIRSVIVRLSARTPGTQPQFAKPTAPRDAAGNVPLTRFTVGGTAPGAARVRTTEVEIFLPNLLPRS